VRRGFDIIDIHCHLLPGLDDGPATMGDSLRMCELYHAQGVRTVVATPHMCDPRYDVTAEAVRLGARQLSHACRERGIDLKVLPGAEVRLQPELLEALDARNLLTVADGGRHLFLELPLQVVPRIGDLLFQLAVRDVTPILTHPERNMELSRKPARLAELVEGGCLVQITAVSLLGGLGRPAKRAAERFVRSGLAHVVASDAHSPKGSRRPQFEPVVERLLRLVGEERTFELLCANPERIVRGAPVGSPQAGSSQQRQSAARVEDGII